MEMLINILMHIAVFNLLIRIGHFWGYNTAREDARNELNSYLKRLKFDDKGGFKFEKEDKE